MGQLRVHTFDWSGGWVRKSPWSVAYSRLPFADSRNLCLKLQWHTSLPPPCKELHLYGKGRGNERISCASGSASFLPALISPPEEPVLKAPPDPALANRDLLPIGLSERNFSVWDFWSLWVGLVVGVPTYYLAGSLVELGLSWWQGIATVVIGNILLLFPLFLSGHAGVKYGIPFPVIARASFGVRGAHIPAVLRALVACGWFGIQTWLGGQGIHVLFNTLLEGRLSSCSITFLGTTLSEWVCFFSFWLFQIAILWDGVDGIRKFEKYCAPLLIVMSVALLTWAYITAGGFGSALLAPSWSIGSAMERRRFWKVFFPALAANIGFWSTISLNISDFTRHAKHQVDPILGHTGLPIFMGLFTFLGLAVTSSSEIIFGRVISNPIELLGQIGGVLPVIASVLGLTLATLTTNVAANVMASANALANLSPRIFSFRVGAIVTAVIGVIFGPWQFMKSSESFISTWLVGYSALLGPLSGITLVDYYIIQKTNLDLDALYTTNPNGKYWYTQGYNLSAIAALFLAVIPCIPGFLHTIGLLKEVPIVLLAMYDNAWMFGFIAAGLMYWAMVVVPQFWNRRPATSEDGQNSN
ncbi:hypothetical protein KP509_07G045000 [Ceratopteris richardii]|uniref:Uncharacterized protein n=1 Tax=Ceratopteris richardii TaxID=49495 RepID=A0A8T2UHU1_CERRI|nr:hypothetical protein KP509_07G045000 [Ceratopteris richardii]